MSCVHKHEEAICKQRDRTRAVVADFICTCLALSSLAFLLFTPFKFLFRHIRRYSLTHSLLHPTDTTRSLLIGRPKDKQGARLTQDRNSQRRESRQVKSSKRIISRRRSTDRIGPGRIGSSTDQLEGGKKGRFRLHRYLYTHLCV